MSLINQALRKAQQDRTPKRMAQPGDESSSMSTVSGGGSGMPAAVLYGLFAVVGLLVLAVIALTIAIFVNQTDSATPESAPVVAATKTITPDPSETTLPEVTAPQPTPIPQAPQASTQTMQTAEAQVSVLEELRMAREAAETKAAEEAALAAAAAKAAAAPPNQNIIDWLSTAKVTGVRMSGANSKAIINNEAYEIGELVHYSLGLKLIVIQETRLLFEDANGKRYSKRL